MNVRLVLTGCPPPGNPNRIRLVRVLAGSTWLEQAELEARMRASPPWLLDAADRHEADAFAALVERIPGVRLTAVPTVGAAVPSLRPALERLESALAAAPEPAAPQPPAPESAPTGAAVTAEPPSPAAAEADLVLDWSRRTPSSRRTAISDRARTLAPPAPLPPSSGRSGALGSVPGLRRGVALLVGLGLAVGAAQAWQWLTRDADVRDDGVVTVLDPGAEPRSPLRYRPAPRHRAAREVTLRLDQIGRAPPGLPPEQGVHGTLVVDVLRVDERIVATDYRVSFSYTRDGAPVRARRLRGQVRTTATGVPGPEPTPTADALPAGGRALGAAFVQLARAPMVKLPRDAVGVGARWSWRLAEDISPFGLPLTFEAELTDTRGGEHTLDLDVRLKAPAADTSWGPLGDLLPGVGIRSVRGRGRGSARVLTTDATPTHIELEVALDIDTAAGPLAARLSLVVE